MKKAAVAKKQRHPKRMGFSATRFRNARAIVGHSLELAQTVREGPVKFDDALLALTPPNSPLTLGATFVEWSVSTVGFQK
jgi:hypothetical protein